MTKAIRNGNLLSWSGIENLNFANLVGTTLTTELDHLDQERKNLKNTKLEKPATINTVGTYVHLVTPTVQDNKCKLKYKIDSDQTGRFPYTSSRGNQYILVNYNAIVVEPIKSRHGVQLAEAFTKCCTKLNLKQREKQLFILDNECPKEVQSTIKSLGGTYQLAPPYQHR